MDQADPTAESVEAEREERERAREKEQRPPPGRGRRDHGLGSNPSLTGVDPLQTLRLVQKSSRPCGKLDAILCMIARKTNFRDFFPLCGSTVSEIGERLTHRTVGFSRGLQELRNADI
jgi:hypothetical protein